MTGAPRLTAPRFEALPTPEHVPALLVRVRVQPWQPITPRQMAVIAMLSEGWTYYQIARFLGITPRSVRFHTLMAARRIPGDRPPSERLIAWYRGASLEVLTGHQVFTPSDLGVSPRQLDAAAGGVVAIPTLAPSAAPAPDYSAPDPNEQHSLKSRSSPDCP